MDHVMAVGGWYLEDREYEVSAQRVMKIIESTSDPRSEYYDLIRRENVPAEELMGRRMETAAAVLAQLGARRNWHRDHAHEWVYADPPGDGAGRAEWSTSSPAASAASWPRRPPSSPPASSSAQPLLRLSAERADGHPTDDDRAPDGGLSASGRGRHAVRVAAAST